MFIFLSLLLLLYIIIFSKGSQGPRKAANPRGHPPPHLSDAPAPRGRAPAPCEVAGFSLGDQKGV